MSRTKSALPVATKLNFTTVEGVPTISIAAELTTRLQVAAVIEQLEKLGGLMPEPKLRRVAARKNGAAPVQRAVRAPRAVRPTATTETIVEN